MKFDLICELSIIRAFPSKTWMLHYLEHNVARNFVFQIISTISFISNL